VQLLLDGKRAVITAAGSGMGRAAALTFAREGATVVVADIREEAAAAVVEEIRGTGGSAEAFAVDVRDLARLKALFDFVGDHFARLDVLYHHAGIPGPAGLDVDVDDFQRTVDINMRSGYYAASYAVPLLRAAGGGSIIFTASVSGLVGSPLSPLYSMTKGGVVLLAKSLALQLSPEGIRVNALCPGATDTPMLPRFFGRLPKEEADRRRAAYEATIPLRRIAQPEEIAAAALFLASDLSSYVTGHALAVDGGVSAQ
jgi:NAD(P)-dependent dehydrogenase (short-subunit alcohol dehydrogenase family)